MNHGRNDCHHAVSISERSPGRKAEWVVTVPAWGIKPVCTLQMKQGRSHTDQELTQSKLIAGVLNVTKNILFYFMPGYTNVIRMFNCR